MKIKQESDLTYVLFGSEAIRMYRISMKLLLSSPYVEYKVDAYNDVKKFVRETKNWDEFLEINEYDFLLLRQHTLKSPLYKISNRKKKRRFSLFNLFK
tara:strand:- start:62115 stop:62408 length:294 start_codon:yes stop_codon:yes gene_type:complete